MIRKFHPKHMDQVVAIWLEASIKAHTFVDKEFWESKAHDMRNIYIPASETFVIEEQGRILGFISLFNHSIAAIFVLPSMQGKGLGMKLIAKAKQMHNDLSLTVYKENLSSIKFYKKCGFEIVQEQTDHHTGYPELLMQFNS